MKKFPLFIYTLLAFSSFSLATEFLYPNSYTISCDMAQTKSGSNPADVDFSEIIFLENSKTVDFGFVDLSFNQLPLTPINKLQKGSKNESILFSPKVALFKKLAPSLLFKFYVTVDWNNFTTSTKVKHLGSVPNSLTEYEIYHGSKSKIPFKKGTLVKGQLNMALDDTKHTNDQLRVLYLWHADEARIGWDTSNKVQYVLSCSLNGR